MKRSRLASTLVSTLGLTSCGGMQGDLATSTEALLPQTLLLPITNDQDYRRWHMGNWHGTTGNPFPPYCRLDSQYPAYQCIYDMQQSGDTDAADRDHLFLSSWSGDDYVAGDGKEGFGVSPLSTQITPGQFATITAIDNMQIRITGSVSPPPWGNPESVQLFAPFETFYEVGDPQYIPQDGNAHELVWTFPTNPRTGAPWVKNQLPVAWEIENGNAIGPSRPGGLFVHSMQVYITYH